jgi:hypothetical protein
MHGAGAARLQAEVRSLPANQQQAFYRRFGELDRDECVAIAEAHVDPQAREDFAALLAPGILGDVNTTMNAALLLPLTSVARFLRVVPDPDQRRLLDVFGTRVTRRERQALMARLKAPRATIAVQQLAQVLATDDMQQHTPAYLRGAVVMFTRDPRIWDQLYTEFVAARQPPDPLFAGRAMVTVGVLDDPEERAIVAFSVAEAIIRWSKEPPSTLVLAFDLMRSRTVEAPLDRDRVRRGIARWMLSRQRPGGVRAREAILDTLYINEVDMRAPEAQDWLANTLFHAMGVEATEEETSLFTSIYRDRDALDLMGYPQARRQSLAWARILGAEGKAGEEVREAFRNATHPNIAGVCRIVEAATPRESVAVLETLRSRRALNHMATVDENLSRLPRAYATTLRSGLLAVASLSPTQSRPLLAWLAMKDNTEVPAVLGQIATSPHPAADAWAWAVSAPVVQGRPRRREEPTPAVTAWADGLLFVDAYSRRFDAGLEDALSGAPPHQRDTLIARLGQLQSPQRWRIARGVAYALDIIALAEERRTPRQGLERLQTLAMRHWAPTRGEVAAATHYLAAVQAGHDPQVLQTDAGALPESGRVPRYPQARPEDRIEPPSSHELKQRSPLVDLEQVRAAEAREVRRRRASQPHRTKRPPQA